MIGNRTFMRAVLAAAMGLVVVLPPAAKSAPVANGKDPIFIGAQACGKCHDGPEKGHQFSKWRMTAHARAYAALSLPESQLIAELSGTSEEPHKAPYCLGCHSTAADSEDWERGEEFHINDGLQCEQCHGPGSEYATEEVMKNPARAKAMGLKTPTKENCRLCHRPKGSHDGVLKREPINLENAWQALAHPLLKTNSQYSGPVTQAGTNESKFTYVGVNACAECHTGTQFNFQMSRWRMSSHARAWAVLGTPKAEEIAREQGISGDPQQSPACLKCHSTGSGFVPGAFGKQFDFRDGVQCESCHGPGSGYSSDKIMRDRAMANTKGLTDARDPKLCQPCHENAHGKTFNYEISVRRIAHPTHPAATAGGKPKYINPQNLTLSPDGREIWTAGEDSASVIVIDAVKRVKVSEISVGGQPNSVAFSPDGKRAFVSNRLDDSVSVIDVASRRVISTLQVGDEPHGLLVDKRGQYLYVLNTSVDTISVIDLATLKETKRLNASRYPWSLAMSPDGSHILVTHALSKLVAERTPSMTEITSIDTQAGVVGDRVVVPGANLMLGVAWHPSGDYALAPLLRTKNLLPMTRVARGWTISNGLGIYWKDGRVDQVLLDQNDLCFPDPTGVTITPDGKFALVTSASTDRIAVVDLSKLMALLKNASPYERERVLPNHLGIPCDYVVKQISVPTCPKGILCSADGKMAFVACMLDDSVAVVDLAKMELAGRIDLGGAKELTQRRRGEKIFHNASITFHRSFSCSTCHPDGHIDGIVYDIEDDGIGMGPIDNRSLRGVNDTAPFKWTGINPNLRRQCGARLAVFITRLSPLSPDALDDLHSYLCSIPRPPNRYRKLGEPLTDAQRRGKAIFERERANDGRPIPPEGRCVTCHPAPIYTDGRIHDVGTKFATDKTGDFDPPHLNNIYDSAPYLHNGIAWTLEEIWTKYNPYDKHGVTSDMTKDQLNDLVEYLKTL